LFYTCACCEYEDGVGDMIPISHLEDKIKSSNLNRLYIIATSQVDNTYSKVYVEAIKEDLNEFGLLKNCNYICKKCANSLKGTFYNFTTDISLLIYLIINILVCS
jgi:hypothetical protein